MGVMQSSNDKNSEPDGENKPKRGIERETIDFHRSKAAAAAAAAPAPAPAPAAEAADELAAAGERLLRLQAEMQNLRNRTSREIADERKYAALPVLTDLLPVIDNIDRAIEAAEKAGEAENLLAGFRLVKQQLHTLLNNHQVEAIAAENEIFDPNFHQA